MRVFVTGVKGQLGYDVMNELEKQGLEGIGVDIDEMDITDADQVNKVIKEAAPDAVIHCAAYTAVDAAEDNEEICRKVNAQGTENIAKVCEELDIKMMYISTDYVFNAADARLVMVNANLPYTAEPAPLLDTADEATGQQLEAEAAMQYRSMAAAAQADGVSLTLVAGYQDADTRQAAYEARVQTYRDKRKSEEEAARLAATIQPAANANEHGTGYAADILSADNPQQDTGFAETRAYEWLTAYAAEYGFILRYPQDRQAATGIVFEPWHWRYVGVENALAIRASGLSLEEFIALQRAD